jgi:hypothetical protein
VFELKKLVIDFGSCEDVLLETNEITSLGKECLSVPREKYNIAFKNSTSPQSNEGITQKEKGESNREIQYEFRNE